MSAERPDESKPVMPVIDRNRCEGKADCFEVCPFHVFDMDVLGPDEKKGLSLTGKIKGWAHGFRQAFVNRPENCAACGLCVQACPERAIKLARRPSA